MRVSKQALLDSINTALTKHENDKQAWDAAVAQYNKQRLAAWMRNDQPKWRALRDLITKSIKDGKPITTPMVESVLTNRRGYGSSYISDNTFSPDREPQSPITLQGGVRVYRPENVENLRDMMALKAFLESSSDTEFSLTSLQRLGFKAPAYVFRAAVK